MSEVRCWSVRLDVAPEAFYATLSDDERSRAARFHFERDRRRFIVARGALRELLACHLDTRASDLRFVYNAFGKPALSPEFGGRLKFNLSHSADLALIALATDREVGVDVEYLRPDEPRTFFEEWTRQEAYVKARGEGLSDGPVEFAEGWALHTFEPASGYIGALAYTTISHANVRAAACRVNPSDTSRRSISAGECTNERNGLRNSLRNAFSVLTTARTGQR
jgi:4'-phosphopantetheinyl transferase